MRGWLVGPAVALSSWSQTYVGLVGGGLVAAPRLLGAILVAVLRGRALDGGLAAVVGDVPCPSLDDLVALTVDSEDLDGWGQGVCRGHHGVCVGGGRYENV